MDEVIPHLYQYLRGNPGAPELSEYDHLLVDEYQDLNRAEQDVLNGLGQNGALSVSSLLEPNFARTCRSGCRSSPTESLHRRDGSSRTKCAIQFAALNDGFAIRPRTTLPRNDVTLPSTGCTRILKPL